MPRRIITQLLLVCAVGSILAMPLAADVLKMPGEPPAVLQSNETPSRGMTQTQVRSRYGDPVATEAAVGDPPISSWDYHDYTIYFEHNLVLHAVVHSEND